MQINDTFILKFHYTIFPVDYWIYRCQPRHTQNDIIWQSVYHYKIDITFQSITKIN
jgi:hypothetical protein